MPVVLDPADLTVPAHNAVFHIVKICFVGDNLLVDALFHLPDILRVDQPGEGIAGIPLKFLQIITAVHPDQRPVGVNQPLVPVGTVDKKPAGHPLCDLFNHWKGLLIEAQGAPLHLFVLVHKTIYPSCCASL